jgi:hypothetical protein
VSDAAAFLLFVLSGAFIFLYRCHYTSYLAARTEGRQLLFRVGAAAACLVILARALLWAGESLISNWGIVGKLWSGVSMPFDIPLLRVYVTAFVLGPVLAYTVNLFYRADTASTRAIERYGTEQEKLLFKAMQDSSLVSVTLESRKVYIGWPVYSPDLRHETNDFRLLPALSGYRKEDDLSLDFTTQYLDIYDHIESEVIEGVRAKDFEIVLPLEKVVSVNRFELDIDQELFRLP